MTRRSWAVLPWLGGLLALYLIAPFLAGLAHLGTADWRNADWHGLAAASVISMLSATVATLLAALGGIPLAYLLARRKGSGMALLGFAVQMPLALPPLTSGILLLFLLGYASPLGALTHGALTDSFIGIVLAEAFVAAPFLIIAARSAFTAIDPVLEDVARTLGHRPAAVFLKASLPLAWRGILAGMLLCWLRAFGEFGATVMVAYHPYSLPVYTYVAFGSEGLPAMVPILIPTLGAALVVMLLATLLTSSRAQPARAGTIALSIPPSPRRHRVTAVQPNRTPQRLDVALRRELRGFTLDIAYGTTARRIAILGASGSGKSLTLRAIAGLDARPADRLRFGDSDLSSALTEDRGIAYVPQNYGLFPHLTAAQQLRFAVDSDADNAQGWFARLGLTGLENRRLEALSLGQQQRIAIARAFSRKAGLLLLDEPFSALDTPLRAQLRDELRDLQAETAATTILVTHDPADAFALADEILIIDAGQVVQAGTIDAVFARPRNAAVARLLGASTTATGIAIAPGLIAIGGGMSIVVSGPPLRPGQPVGWAVAPTRLRIVTEGGYAATILSAEPPIAGQQVVHLRLGDAVLTVKTEADDRLCPGPTHLVIPPSAVQIWAAHESTAPAAIARRLAVPAFDLTE